MSRRVHIGETPDAVTAVSCSTPFTTLCGLSPTTTYRVYVRALCENVDSTLYSEWSPGMEIQSTAGIATSDDNTQVTLKPNPASDRLTVLSYYGILGVELYDLQGRKVQSWHTDRMPADNLECMGATLDIGHLAKGTYIAVVNTMVGVTTRKVVKR